MENNNVTNTAPIGMPNMTEEERQSELSMLKNSWIMYERTKKETIEMRSKKNKNGVIPYKESETKKTMNIIENMQNDIKKKYLQLGGTMEELLSADSSIKKKTKKERSEMLRKVMEREKEEAQKQMAVKMLSDEDVAEINRQNELSFFAEDNTPKETPVSAPVEEKANSESPVHDSFDINATSKTAGGNIKYDTIPLPSKGQCYKLKMSKLPVGYLTAYDENMIVAPNMYRDGSFLDHILKNKIMTDEISPDELLPGDRDAIILWLRASGYGADFPIKVTDPTTGIVFDTTIDLSTLKYKKFELKGDANGYFSFELPVTKDKVKFRFLTYGDIKELEKMEEEESASIKKTKIEAILNDLDNFIDSDKEVEPTEKVKLAEALKTIQKYKDDIKSDDDMEFTHAVTNRMLKSIISINGITNRDYINEYVMYMNVRDSSALRKYIIDNEPGVDFNIEVQRPESLGGDSMTTFLTIDQFIFLNIA